MATGKRAMGWCGGAKRLDSLRMSEWHINESVYVCVSCVHPLSWPQVRGRWAGVEVQRGSKACACLGGTSMRVCVCELRASAFMATGKRAMGWCGGAKRLDSLCMSRWQIAHQRECVCVCDLRTSAFMATGKRAMGWCGGAKRLDSLCMSGWQIAQQ